MRISLQLLLILVFAISSACGGDLEVLLKLKSSMTGARDSRLEDWDSSRESTSAHCSFSGVACDGGNRVVSLNVSAHNLSGSLPPEIGLLNNVEIMILASNNLTGRIPVEMANLTSLKILNISNNLFMGNFPGEIALGMTSLEVLDLSLIHI